MTIRDRDYALLTQDGYNHRSVNEELKIGGIAYTVIARYSNPISGYQGTAYQRDSTKEVVLVNRGTEPSLADATTDASMVLTGLNAQLIDARAFANIVEHKVGELAVRSDCPTPPITTAGHSLGGTIAEILAHEFHWQGTTFNAYGAVDLGYSLPQGGAQVTNYVRAVDVVSAASHHFGKVVVLAPADDIDRLGGHGYTDAATVDHLRNPIGALNLGAHSIDNFVDGPDRPSDLSQENEARARAHGHAIALYREDVRSLRSNILSLGWRLQHKQSTAAKLFAQSTSAALHGDLDRSAEFSNLAWKRTVDNVSHAANTVAHTAKLGITAIDQLGAAIAEPIRQSAQAAVQYAGDALHVGNIAGAPHPDPQHPVDSFAVTPHDRPDPQKLTRAALYGITPASSTDEVFEALCKAAEYKDDVGMMAIGHAHWHSPENQAQQAEARTYIAKQERVAQLAKPPTPPRLDDPSHPDHAMYLQAREGVHKLDQTYGRTTNVNSDMLAASLVVEARRQRFSAIHEVHLSADRQRVIARDTSLIHTALFHVEVKTLDGLNTPIELSSQQWQDVVHERTQEQVRQHTQTHSRGMSR